MKDPEQLGLFGQVETETCLTGSGTTTPSLPDRWEEQARKKREYRQQKEVLQRERQRDRERDSTPERREFHRANHERHAHTFIGVDGEGANLDNGYHAYNMLRAGNEMLYPRDGEVRLRTYDCLNFLSQLQPNRVYVIFFGDYDWSKVLEDLPWNRLEKLMDRNSRKRDKGGWFPVDVFHGEFQIDYMPRKEFKVRKKNGPWIVIHDVGSFFQTSFVSALTLWGIGTEQQRDDIAEGKALRAKFAEIEADYIDKYNHLECELLADLMTSFRDACNEVGYTPRKWQGPGLLAEAMFVKHGIPPTEDYFASDNPIPADVWDYGRYSFYGGWFETGYVGYTWATYDNRTPCDQYDLNSAYPAALQYVPCLLHGTWSREIGPRTIHGDELSLCFAGFRPKKGGKRFSYGGLPIRRFDGSIHHPAYGKGWYWSFEMQAAIHQEVTVYDSWVYERHCDCKPFAFLEDVYYKRKQMGKAGKGIVLKLAMNSVYGKLAQSIGDPKYSNPIWASFITAWCRTQIQWAIHSLPMCADPNPRVPCGFDVYMIATDAIFTRHYNGKDWGGIEWNPYEHLSIGDKLGQWDREIHDTGLFIVQPGLYFDPTSNDAKFKTRGVPRSMVVEHKDEIMAAYARMRETRRISDGDILLPMVQFIGIRQALHRHNTKILGQFIPYKDPITGEPGRRTSFDWQTKRRPQPLLDPMEGMNGTQLPYIATAPYLGTHDESAHGRPIQTVPYDKDIGGLQRRTLLREDFEGQPDWMPLP